MNHPTESPSTPRSDSSAEWPVNAIPERWVEMLFDVMSATYGVRFADLWRGTKLELVKRQWGVELARLTNAQMKSGRETMTDLERPPTLPEFMAHCRRARLESVASEVPKIEHNSSVAPEQAESNLEILNDMIGVMHRSNGITAEWAFKAIIRGKSMNGKPYPFTVANCATDAITSSAGRKVVEECIDPELKHQYDEIRQTIVDNYRMRGMKLWETP